MKATLIKNKKQIKKDDVLEKKIHNDCAKVNPFLYGSVFEGADG